MIEIQQKKECCGCSACAQKCPKNCIEMKPDNEGFLYPYINQEACIHCNLCNQVCPIINDKFEENYQDTYIAYANSQELRMKSSSGAIFSLCAEYILQNGGVVFGAAFDSEMLVHHIKVQSFEDLKYLRGSKYLQSRIEDTYLEAESILEKGRLVLYTGTACQIAGLKRFLKKEYTNLYTIDVLCHGVPSPMIWKRYINELEVNENSKIDSICFRSKETGWKNFSMQIIFKNNVKYQKKFSEDYFMKLFLSNLCLRPSCHDCHFKELNRPSDLTIGDCWGVDYKFTTMDDDKGTSILIIH